MATAPPAPTQPDVSSPVGLTYDASARLLCGAATFLALAVTGTPVMAQDAPAEEPAAVEGEEDAIVVTGKDWPKLAGRIPPFAPPIAVLRAGWRFAEGEAALRSTILRVVKPNLHGS